MSLWGREFAIPVDTGTLDTVYTPVHVWIATASGQFITPPTGYHFYLRTLQLTMDKTGVANFASLTFCSVPGIDDPVEDWLLKINRQSAGYSHSNLQCHYEMREDQGIKFLEIHNVDTVFWTGIMTYQLVKNRE